MTVVIGLLGSDGAVIGADTQLTAGNIKATATKVLLGSSGQGKLSKSIAVGGAGDYGYFQALRLKLSMALLTAMHRCEETGDTLNSDVVESSILQVLIPFYEQSIMPFYRCPEEDRPDVYTISALWSNEHGALWTTDKMSVRPVVTGYDTTGYGAGLAGEYLHGLYRENSPIDSLVLLAAYVIWQVKRLMNPSVPISMRQNPRP